MRLIEFNVSNFRSIRSSGVCAVGDVTCLVGKNEAGKTALLKALYKLNPIISDDGNFDLVADYPRSDLSDYEAELEGGKKHVNAINASFKLENDDLAEVEKIFGKGVIKDGVVGLTKGYDNERRFNLKVDDQAALKHLIKQAELPPELQKQLSDALNASAMEELLGEQEQTAEVKRLLEILKPCAANGVSHYIYNSLLSKHVPKFLYFDEYYQMRGHENIEALLKRKSADKLEPADYPMMGLIELARLKLEDMLTPSRAAELRGRLEGAGNSLTNKALKYWSQNKHIQMRFDVQPGRPEDPEGMRQGTNLWALVYDTRHQVSTELGSRSRGFVWFFSFLAWYSKIQKEHGAVILLLDEPGLFLHGKAQEDLLRFFEQELKANHQLLYSTHSPFMVDSRRFDRVRIVEDKGIDSDNPDEQREGTKVIVDALSANTDSLFPLQGALGYEIYQTLFVGPNCLLVEGISDLLYLETISESLHEMGKVGLSKEWTITPVGGSDKIGTFAALMGSQKGLKIATLIDIQKKDEQAIANLYKKKLLKKAHVHTFGDFTGSGDADIEDMFDEDFYLKLVNAAFGKELGAKALKIEDLPHTKQRILVRLEAALESRGDKSKFSHYRPARFFAEKLANLKADISSATFERFENAFKALNKLL